MEASYQWTAEKMRLRVPIISHAVSVMVLDLVFYTKDPDGVGDAVNIFFFLDLFLASGYKSALL